MLCPIYPRQPTWRHARRVVMRPSQVVRPGARSVFREVTLGTDNNEASAPELFSAARPEDRSGDAVKIWNHTQVAMRGKRIIGAPRG
jgi:hypothetical protein